ncbi:MAG: hypothetical protein AABY83_01615 [Pseudomonadota bacterium]
MTQRTTPIAQIAYYHGDRHTGALTLVNIDTQGEAQIHAIPSAPASALPPLEKPVLLGVTPARQGVVLDPKTKKISLCDALPADSFPAHVYRDPYSGHDWYMNDGDKDSGNDTLNCGQQGSSVSVVADSARPQARLLATICVGRGHHQAAFTAPSPHAPQVPRRAFISNLKDGTLSVIGADPNDAATYLKCISTLNLCEPEKESLPDTTIPNNAYPHGLVYSPVTGKVYNLNNGYGTVAIIDPATARIEKRIDFKGHSNLFIAAGGRYVIGRGADRKRDPHHVIAKLSVLDATNLQIVDTLDIPDIYISKYYLNGDESKLYLTTSVSGSPEQQQHLKTDTLVVLDMHALPKLKINAELRVGPIGGLAFYPEHGMPRYVFASHAPAGELIMIDSAHAQVIKRIPAHTPCEYSRIWLAT